MVRANFDKVFLLGLYAYLRQIELSIDRGLSDSWEKLFSYFEHKISPQKVITYLESQSVGKSKLSVNSGEEILEIRFFDRVKSSILKVFGKNPHLSETEISNICSVLNKFFKLLEGCQSPEREKIIQLRIQLNSYCEAIALKLSNKDVRKAQHVEHFNQNESLHCVSLEEIVGGVWLK